jgi:hypothetical protein
MSARITSGTSWPGRRPGTRHWFSVSYYLHLWELGLGGAIWFAVLAVPVLALASLWVALEALVLIASAVLIALNAARRVPLAWELMHWQRLGLGLWSVLVPERGSL